MNKKSFSRRDFLKMIPGVGLATVLGKLLKFFPEVDPAFAKSGSATSASTMPPIPDDLLVTPIKGGKAAAIIAQVMQGDDGLALQSKLPLFKPVPNEARVSSAVWAGGAQKAIIVSIHFVNPRGGEAILQHVTMNGTSETVMVVIPNISDPAKAMIYTVVDKQINMIDTAAVNAAQAAAGSGCNQTQMISCLQAYGCSGWALTSCIVAFVTCPFTLWGCVAAFACSAYCGGAFSQCWCLLCGC